MATPRAAASASGSIRTARGGVRVAERAVTRAVAHTELRAHVVEVGASEPGQQAAREPLRAQHGHRGRTRALSLNARREKVLSKRALCATHGAPRASSSQRAKLVSARCAGGAGASSASSMPVSAMIAADSGPGPGGRTSVSKRDGGAAALRRARRRSR